ncbi:MAG: glycosyltransferase family 4 protein [Bacteroidetes bacterium]|nr:glycosyltransferase family 4 protein [Bacteroidota bacterium]
MNILFISSIQMWGGGEVFLMDIMKGLRQKGHNVFLLCRQKTELAENAVSLGFDVTTIRIAGDFDPFVIWNAFRVMKKKHIDLICTNMDKDLRFGGLAAKLAGVKGIVPSREIDYPLKNTFRYKFFYKTIATQIIVNSLATKKTVLKSAPWLDEKNISIIYKGISLEPYSAPLASNIKTELHLPDSAKIISFVGQLDERKGITYLLEAWKNIAAAVPDSVLLIIGKGKLQHSIETFIEENQLHHSIKLLGFRNDIPSILRQSFALTLPSLWEGFGYVLVEAMAAKIPTVATNTSSIPEIVINGITGILVEPKNSPQLADAFFELINSPVKASVMGNAGRMKMEQQFTIEKMVNAFEEVFLASIRPK